MNHGLNRNDAEERFLIKLVSLQNTTLIQLTKLSYVNRDNIIDCNVNRVKQIELQNLFQSKVNLKATEGILRNRMQC